MCSLDFSATGRHILWWQCDIATLPREFFGKISQGEVVDMQLSELLSYCSRCRGCVSPCVLPLRRFMHNCRSLAALLWAQTSCPCRTPGTHPYISPPACLAFFTIIYCLNEMVIIFCLLPSLFSPHLCFRQYLGPFVFHNKGNALWFAFPI